MKQVILKKASNTVNSILFILVCLLAAIVLFARVTGNEPAIFGLQVKAVLSGSMEPTFHTGSIIAIELRNTQSTYKAGDIITFRIHQDLITHRIINVENRNGQAVYKTKGDHNNGPDYWTVPIQDVVGKYTGFTIPYLGYALKYAGSKFGAALLLVIPGIFFILNAFGSIMGLKKELEASKS